MRAWWLRGGEAGIAQLEEALRLRRDVLRDRAAAERTQRTLDAIRPPPPPSWWQRWHVLPLLVALLVLGLGTVGAVKLFGGGEPTNRVLTVRVLGDGVVIARYDDGQRRCRTECHVTVADGIAVDLSSEGEGFEAWSGDCGGSGECSLTMDGDRAVTARIRRRRDADTDPDRDAVTDSRPDAPLDRGAERRRDRHRRQRS